MLYSRGKMYVQKRISFEKCRGLEVDGHQLGGCNGNYFVSQLKTIRGQVAGGGGTGNCTSSVG